MNELFNFANNTFAQNLIFLVVLAILLAVLIIILYIVLKRLIGNRDVKIGDWVKIEGKGNEPDKQVAKEAVVILDKKELSKTLVNIKKELADLYSKESSEHIKEIVEGVINFQEILYFITNRFSEIYEGLLLMSRDDVTDIFMDQELLEDFNCFRNMLIGARIHTVKKMSSIVCKNIKDEKILIGNQIDGITFKILMGYVSSNYKSLLVPRKDFIEKAKDASTGIQVMIDIKYKNDFIHNITKRGIEKEKEIKDLIRDLFNEIYRAKPN